MSAKIHFDVGTWNPALVADFLKIHNFKQGDKYNGDDCYWIGKKLNGEDAQVAYPVMRLQLTTGTMRDSVMRHSGYSKEHWDYFRYLKKGQRKKRVCCEKIKE